MHVEVMRRTHVIRTAPGCLVRYQVSRNSLASLVSEERERSFRALCQDTWYQDVRVGAWPQDRVWVMTVRERPAFEDQRLDSRHRQRVKHASDLLATRELDLCLVDGFLPACVSNRRGPRFL